MTGSRIPAHVLSMACEAVRPLTCGIVPEPAGEGFELRVHGEPLATPLTFHIARIATETPRRYAWLLLDVREVLKSHGCVLADWPAGDRLASAPPANTMPPAGFNTIRAGIRRGPDRSRGGRSR